MKNGVAHFWYSVTKNYRSLRGTGHDEVDHPLTFARLDSLLSTLDLGSVGVQVDGQIDIG